MSLLRLPLVRVVLAFVTCITAGVSVGAVVALDRVVITTSDLGEVEAFYAQALGFRAVERGSIDAPLQRLFGVAATGATLTMQLGRERVEFIRFDRPGRPYPIASRSSDFWFQHIAIVVDDLKAAYARLHLVRFQAITVGGPQTLPEEDGRVGAFKFRDPDGHPLELIYFPPGQGRTVWASASDGITIGIDHTAIAVSQTAASLKLYRELLGMSVAYQVLNRGVPQERLDGLFDAMVEVTGLRPQSTEGPGIELLDYRSPSNGRQPPPDTAANDLAHVQTVLRVDDLEATVSRLNAASTRFISPGIVELSSHEHAVSILDPDGHALILEQ